MNQNLFFTLPPGTFGAMMEIGGLGGKQRCMCLCACGCQIILFRTPIERGRR